MTTLLKRLTAYFDHRRTLVKEIERRKKQSPLTTDPADIRLLQGALSECTFRTHQHVYGKRHYFPTRITTIDDFILCLIEINDQLRNQQPITYSRLLQQQVECTLYDFLVTNRGFVVSIPDALARSYPHIETFLGYMDEYNNDEMSDHRVTFHQTELMRWHLTTLLSVLVNVSDQAKPL